jgi:hypothetical protein
MSERAEEVIQNITTTQHRKSVLNSHSADVKEMPTILRQFGFVTRLVELLQNYEM